MAPLKFEDNIKEKLEERVIQPSKGSWDRLASQLNEDNPKKDKGRKGYWFLGIAASIIGAVIATSTFQNSQTEKENIQFVEATKEIQEIREVKKDIQLVEVPEKKLKEVLDDNTLNDKSEIDKEGTKAFRKKQLRNHSDSNHTIVASVDNVSSNNVTDTNSIDKKKNEKQTKSINKSDQIFENLIIDEQLINTKIADVFTKVKELEKADMAVTDQEIEALLYNAQKEILIEQINTNKVSATALLQQVELELDESFKERVFEALKIGFNKLKTAVAEREN